MIFFYTSAGFDNGLAQNVSIKTKGDPCLQCIYATLSNEVGAEAQKPHNMIRRRLWGLNGTNHQEVLLPRRD